ncbi:solute carrier organic anion transporter family member 6A1 isoform X3 [Mesocricetus auratus]|uniref:Solute carrier organic anion transporter family member 6A1 isoform X3 n=1 Tax=Mesocricetus auratus TaxID=10036 RepID=A0ABM2Y1E0_MESAU|nr:solute carrier organic anion transporter family member 6A1 isoform X3 [Mesocricetus auratus]
MDQEPEQTQSSSTEDETEARPDKVQQPSKAPRKIAPLLASFPTAMMKFTSFKKHKMPVSSNATKLPDVKKDASLEGPFGLGPLVFPNLQRFNNIKFFLTLYCMVVLAQGFIFGLVGLSIGHFQKEFYLSIPENIILSFSYDFISLLVAILVAYYGSRWHRPKWVAAAAFLVGLGSMFCAVTYMKYQVVMPKEESEGYNFLWEQVNCWAGFLAATLLAWFAFLPLLCFPTNLPGSHKLRHRKRKEPVIFDKRLKHKKFGPHLKDLLSALQCLSKCPLLICHAMCKATESLSNIGATEFLPKYLENQFLLTPSLATLLTGIILVPGGAIGNFLGGFIVSKLKMSCKSQMRFVMVTSIISLLLFILIVFVECEAVHFAGISEDYDGSGNLGNLTAPCNNHCGCESSDYASVCGRDDTEYFSPCFAGCTSRKIFNNEKTYYNCSCIKEGLTTADFEGDFVDAFPGKCNTKCFKLPLFFAFFFSSIAFSSSATIPIILIILRTLPPNLKSLGMGVTYTTLRLFGSIPGPILFRLTANNSCIYWDVNKCGIRGRCWIYNKSRMVYILLGLCSACKLSTTLLVFSALRKYDFMIAESSENLNLPEKKAKETKKGKK